nr:LacI family DNA-binding transcriptional regulator [Phyllobacterium myrsinacearum]
MADVAKAAGCSQATVSLVLNEVMEIKISQELRARVLASARKLGYGQAGPIKRSALEGIRGSSIGFIVNQLTTTPEAINAIEGARQASWEHNVTLLIAQTLDRPDHEEMAVERLLRAGVDGVIYMSIFTRRVDMNPIFKRLSVPLVLLNCYTTDGEFPAVVPDEVEGGRRATATLLELGHQRVATVTGEMYMDAAQARLVGYNKAHAEAKIETNPDYVTGGNWTPSSGYDATRKLMSLKYPPTAIFCQNDKMALGCLNALFDLGLRVPEDVSIIGYDDDEICRHIRPQLSSVDLPHRTMGAWAVAELFRHKQRVPHYEVTKIDCAFIARSSSTLPPPLFTTDNL